jgi:transcription termination factor Rho
MQRSVKGAVVNSGPAFDNHVQVAELVPTGSSSWSNPRDVVVLLDSITGSQNLS